MHWKERSNEKGVFPEDLLEDTPINHAPQAPTTKRKAVTDYLYSSIALTPIETLIAVVAKVLGIDIQELSDWGEETSIPTSVLKNKILTAKRYKLNPLLWSDRLGI